MRGDIDEALIFKGGDLAAGLARLDRFAQGAAFLVGHNLMAFDAPHLEAAKPDLRLLRLPRIDTLRLNPLAFPRNPYHHLVKHYQDGQLKRGRRNDPELDARLTLEVFQDQQRVLREAAHRAISSLGVGSVLRLELEREKWILKEDRGVIVGRLAASYAPPRGMKCTSARVAAIVVWRREDSNPEYQALHKCDRWEVVVPELVFEPR